MHYNFKYIKDWKWDSWSIELYYTIKVTSHPISRMGIILSVLGIEEPTSYENPQKKILATLYGIQISLAHLLNVLISIFGKYNHMY